MVSRFLPVLASVLLLAACGGDVPPAAEAAPGAAATPTVAAAATAPEAATTPQALPTVVVFKTEACGCCNGWVEHLRAAGFQVDARDVLDLASIKRDAGVTAAHASCHTALVDGYVVEGHVPADQVKKLLAERPDVAGLAVPGMPVGSPGMEGPGAKPYQVLALDRQGGSTVWAEVDPR